MACPTCQSDKRFTLAPGYYECRGTITVTETSWVPNFYPPGHPGYAHVPIYKSRTKNCRHRYQEAGPGVDTKEVCGCGLFAVGRCIDCNTPRCGRCNKDEFPVRCPVHRRAAEAAATQIREKEEAAARASAQAHATDQVVAEATRLLKAVATLVTHSNSIDDPVERVIAAATAIRAADLQPTRAFTGFDDIWTELCADIAAAVRALDTDTHAAAVIDTTADNVTAWTPRPDGAACWLAQRRPTTDQWRIQARGRVHGWQASHHQHGPVAVLITGEVLDGTAGRRLSHDHMFPSNVFDFELLCHLAAITPLALPGL